MRKIDEFRTACTLVLSRALYDAIVPLVGCRRERGTERNLAITTTTPAPQPSTERNPNANHPADRRSLLPSPVH